MPKVHRSIAKTGSAKKTSNKISPELQKVVDSINKKFGDNTITVGVKQNNAYSEKIPRIPTGSISLDIALGGGIPVGRFTEISGAFSSTKTTQCLHIIKNAQKIGLNCALIDVENTTDEQYLREIGVDYDNLIYTNPSSMEEALQVLTDLQKSGVVNLAVLDSIAAVMASNKELESDMDETVRMGIPQQMFGEFFRKYQMNNNKLAREGKPAFTLIGINQEREKIGAYGDPTYTPGGRAKGFTASVDLRLRRGDWIVEGKGENKEIVGQVVKFKICKNKTFRPMQSGEFDFYFSENTAGVIPYSNDIYKEIVISAVEWGIIQRSGSWFMYKDQKFQGINAVVTALKETPEIVGELKEQVIELAQKGVD